MWVLIIGIAWVIGVVLLLAFLRGASIANERYDDGYDASVLRALNSDPMRNRAA